MITFAEIVVLNTLAEDLVGCVGDPVELPQAARIGMVLRPLLHAVQAQEVAVVGEELFQAGARDVGQLDFGFFGGSRGHAAFDDVLLAGTSRPDHLIVGPAALADTAIAEIDGSVVDNLGLLVGEQFLVATVLRDEASAHCGFLIGQ
jgi:hypothetical protein